MIITIEIVPPVNKLKNMESVLLHIWLIPLPPQLIPPNVPSGGPLGGPGGVPSGTTLEARRGGLETPLAVE